jgi:hypothetical protein
MQQYKVVPPQEVEKRLVRTIQEHSDLNARVDELAKKGIITPDEEMELKRLRKLKLYKKDMIAYLKTMVKGAPE